MKQQRKTGLIKRKFKKIVIGLILATIIFPMVNINLDSHALNSGLTAEWLIPDSDVSEHPRIPVLMLEPGQEEVLQAYIENNTENDITFSSIIVHTPTTLDRGKIYYRPRDIEHDPSLQHPVEDLINITGEKTVPANGSVIINLNIKMPEEEFLGILLGSLYLRWEQEIDGETAHGSLFRWFYLRNNMDDVPKEFALGEVTFGTFDEEEMFRVHVRNTASRHAFPFIIAAFVTDGNGTGSYHSRLVENMEMAPNTGFNFPLRLGKNDLNAGDYILWVSIFYGTETWLWQYDLQVTDDGVWVWGEHSLTSHTVSEAEDTSPNLYEQTREEMESLLEEMLGVRLEDNSNTTENGLQLVNIMGTLILGILLLLILGILLLLGFVWLIKKKIE